MISSNSTVFLGPLWGNSQLINSSKVASINNPLVFYGGYLFFSNSSDDEIQKLLTLEEKRKNVHFNLSRFEEYFLTIAGFQEEKNYQFRRWINPLSGILSATEYYGISTEELFATPENISLKLKKDIKFKKDLIFYEKLQPNLIPPSVLVQIENSIESKDAFKQLSLYDSSGNCLEKLAFPEMIVDSYVSKCHESIGKFERRGLKI